MKNLFFSLLFLPFLLQAEPVRVLVSVAPYIEIVREIGGEAVDVKMLVPEGIDSHSFEPSPETLSEAIKGAIWFQVGECFETKVESALKNQNSALKTFPLQQLMGDTDHDPHIWMSIEGMQKQASYIAEILQQEIPMEKEHIQSNVAALLARLQELKSSIATLLLPKKGMTIATAHPSYTLFCNEFDLQQLAIENHMKEPSIKEIAALHKKLKELHITTIFAQSEYGHKGAQAIAQDIGAEIVFLPDASPRYFEMMQRIAEAFDKAARGKAAK